MKRALLFLSGLIVLAAAVVWFSGARPDVEVMQPAPLRAIGAATATKVRVTGGNGVRWFRARLEQGGEAAVLFEQRSDEPQWRLWRERQRERVYEFVAGRKTMPNLKDGAARLVLEARSDDLRGSVTTRAIDVTVRTTPPRLSVDGAQHYINQGGSELVLFTVSPDATESGVRVGLYRFRSWALPGGPSGARFAFFAFPYDVPADTAPVVYARDDAGNEVTATFWFRVFPKKFRIRELELTEDFLEKVTRQFPPSSGDLLADFLKINREMRQQNNRQLADLRFQTEERFLWSRPFRQLADTKVEAQFADHRRYYYQGKLVDEQDHLGFDLAKTANAAVVAANDGKVVFADALGIYGNCVVIDHGFGLQSIYGHLSSFAVKAGDAVRQGQEIGRTGETGLAGGDHLHFSMQVEGVQVTAVEWWDPHWIHDRILLKFPEKKLPAGPTAAGVASPRNPGLAALVDGRGWRGSDHPGGAR